MISLLILLAGLAIWLATEYDTLGIVFTAIGAGLLLLQLVFLVVFSIVAVRSGRSYSQRVF